MFSFYKNSYLQLNSNVNPRIINRSVQKARDYLCIDEHDLEPPFHRLSSEQPITPLENLDVTRRPCGFGRLALRKLRTELHHPNEEVVIAALLTIYDLVKDPEKTCEAVTLNIPDRMSDLILHESVIIRERSLMVLRVLAESEVGKEAIVKNKSLLSGLKSMLVDHSAVVRFKLARVLREIASSWKAADQLIEEEFMKPMIHILDQESDHTIAIHLETLKFLMYCNGKCIAINCDAYEKFVLLLDRKSPQIITGTLECLMMITSTKKGKNIAYSNDLLFKVIPFLFDERPEIHTQAASVLMYCTITAKAKIVASKIKDLPKRLLDISKNYLNRSAQIYAMKILTNISEHPKVRKLMQKCYVNDIDQIRINDDPDLLIIKNTLKSVVTWTPTEAI